MRSPWKKGTEICVTSISFFSFHLTRNCFLFFSFPCSCFACKNSYIQRVYTLTKQQPKEMRFFLRLWFSVFFSTYYIFTRLPPFANDILCSNNTISINVSLNFEFESVKKRKIITNM